MGYYAYANEDLEFAPMVSVETFVTKVVPEIRDTNIWCHLGNYRTLDKNGMPVTTAHIHFEHDGNYWEEDVNNALELLAPYVEEGSAIYFNGDDAKWKFELVNGKWIERNCYDYYESDSDYNAQYVIDRQGFHIGLTNDELRSIYYAISLGQINIDEEEKEDDK